MNDRTRQRQRRTIEPWASRCAFACSGAVLVACGCSGPAGPDRPSPASSGPAWTRAEPRAPSGVGPAGAPVAVNGSPVTWETLRPLLAEAAGGLVLEEVVFDVTLAEEARRQGVAISPDDIAREERLLARTLGGAAGADEAATARLIEDVRRARGLGDVRYRALLERTALMRRLVAGEVRLTEAALAQMHETVHGERCRVRIITVVDPAGASEALRRLRAGEPFGEVAAALSTDPSAARGGIVEPISPADPSYPAGVRAALRTLTPGALSDPIGIDTGFAIVLLEERVAPDGVTIEEDRAGLEEAVRLRQERAAMSRLAERLLAGADVAVFDPRLEQAWRMRRERGL